MRTPVLPALLAVIGPLVVTSAGLGALERLRTADDARQEQNAGRVLNGQVVVDDAALAMERLLDQAEPRVVILGNSLSNTDLVEEELARGLGLPRASVVKLSIPNSMAAHWYAVLKNRVYAHGHTPELVVVASDLQSLLALSPRSEASHVNLAVQLTDDEPRIDALLGFRWWPIERARENRALVKDAALRALRDDLVDAAWWGGPTDHRETAASLARTFADDRVDHRLHQRVIPVFSGQDELAFDPSELAAPEDGFLPDLADLARSHGSRLVFVRPPMSPLLPEGTGDVVLPEAEAAVPELVTRHGALWLDLRNLPVAPSQFQNVDHMNDEGARRFSRIVAQLVAEPSDPPTRSLLETHQRSDEGHDRVVPARVVFPRRPMRLPRSHRGITSGRASSAWFETRDLAALSDGATMQWSPLATRCSPVRVLDDGQPLPVHGVSCEEVFRLGHGRACHTPDRVFFTREDGSDPVEGGRQVELALDTSRSCEEALWSYPGDDAHLASPTGVTGRAVALEVDGTDVLSTGRGGTGGILLRVVDPQHRVLAETELAPVALGAKTRIPLAGPAEAAGLRVELENRTDHFLLWTTIAWVLDEVDSTHGTGRER